MRAAGLALSATATFAALCLQPVFAQNPALVERGRALANGVAACGICHTPRDANGMLQIDRVFAGGNPFKEPQFAAFAPNTTPDPDTGIGQWTDA
jgi:mono/diheme cytochrome c family protein